MAYQGRLREANLRLEDSGTPVTGVLFSNLLVKFRKNGSNVFTTKTLVSGDWTEIASGFYILRFSESEMSEIGEFLYWVTSASGPAFGDVVGRFDIEPQPLSLLAAPDVCIVSGNIVDIGGVPGTDSKVVFRAAKTPSVISTSLIEGKIVQTSLDIFGGFSVALLRGKKVVVEIERSGIRHVITIPDQETANIIDILPPIED